MKILFVTSKPPYPPTDGIRIKTYNLIRELGERNDIYLISFYDDEKEISSGSLRVYANICKDSIFIPKPEREGRLARLLNDILCSTPSFVKDYRSSEFSTKIRCILEEFKPDVVHLDTINLTEYISDIKGISPCVASPNDCLSLAYLDDILYGPLWLRRIPKKIWKVMQFLKVQHYERKAYEGFDACFLVSEKDRDYLGKICKKTYIEVIPNGVDMEYYLKRGSISQRESPSIIFFGDMSGGNSEYAWWFIKRVLPAIKKKNKELKMYIVGNNPNRRLKKYSEDDPQVVVTGYVEDIRPFIENSDIVVSPVLKRCGILNKVLIGMAMEKPIVGTRQSFTGLQGMVDGINAMSVKGKREFARRVSLLLEEREEAREIGKNARNLVEKMYRWEDTAMKVERLYRRAIGKFENGSSNY